MQIFVKSFGGVRLYFSGEGKEGERLSRGIPLFCKRDIARRMQATRSSSCRPSAPPAQPPAQASVVYRRGGDRQYARIQLRCTVAPTNSPIRDHTLESLPHNRLLSVLLHIEQ